MQRFSPQVRRPVPRQGAEQNLLVLLLGLAGGVAVQPVQSALPARARREAPDWMKMAFVPLSFLWKGCIILLLLIARCPYG